MPELLPTRPTLLGWIRLYCFLKAMGRISSQEFLAQRFRVHAFLADVPLHDVWAVDLPGFREGITLHEFHARTSKADSLKRVSWPTRALFSLRLLIGQILGLESEPSRIPAILLRQSAHRRGSDGVSGYCRYLRWIFSRCLSFRE